MVDRAIYSNLKRGFEINLVMQIPPNHMLHTFLNLRSAFVCSVFRIIRLFVKCDICSDEGEVDPIRQYHKFQSSIMIRWGNIDLFFPYSYESGDIFRKINNSFISGRFTYLIHTGISECMEIEN